MLEGGVSTSTIQVSRSSDLTGSELARKLICTHTFLPTLRVRVLVYMQEDRWAGMRRVTARWITMTGCARRHISAAPSSCRWSTHMCTHTHLHVCGMNFSHVRHDTPQQRPVRADCIHIAYTQTCRRTHMHMGDAAPPRVRHDSSVRVPCRIHTARMHTHRTNVRLIWRTRSMPLSLTTGSAISWRAPTLTCLLPKNNPRASAHHVIPLVLYLLHVRAPPPSPSSSSSSSSYASYIL